MIIDLTHSIQPEMSLYPDTPAPAFSPLRTITRDGFRETDLHLTSHTGTHMDAPSHMLRGGSTLDQMPISQFRGRAVVLDVSGIGPTVTFCTAATTISTARILYCFTPAGRSDGERRATWRTPLPCLTRRRPGIFSPAA